MIKSKAFKKCCDICINKGYKIISKYQGYYKKIECICDKDHHFFIRLPYIKNDVSCPQCMRQNQKKDFFKKVIKKQFTNEGYKLLTTEYIDETQHLDYICPQGHKHSMAWYSFRSGSRCPSCKIRKPNPLRHSYNYIKSYIESFGFKLLSKKYINNIQKLKISCKNNHIKEMTWGTFVSSKKICKKCELNKKIEPIRKEFEKYGYKLLTNEYQNGRTKLHYICPNGHKHYITWNSFRKGHRCMYCANNLKYKLYTFDQVQEIVSKEGYIIDKDSFIDACQKFKCICKRGHELIVNLYDWINLKKRCIRCRNIEKFGYDEFSFDYIKQFIKDNDYKCLSDQYVSAQSKLVLECPNQHIYKVSWNNFQRGKRCPQCYEKGSSFEDEVYNFIREFYQGTIIRNDRKQISPSELDLYFPDEKIAIECCGLYWHSEAIVDKKYHYKKYKKCQDNNLRLIQIFEDEWINKRNIVKSRIKSILGYIDNKIYARNTIVRKINNNIALRFCSNNHIQGKSNSHASYGLFYDNNLISVMTFAKPSIAKGRAKVDFELNRFCSKLNYVVVGGASKLFAQFLNDYPNHKIVSYCDLRWNTGNLYEILNMEMTNYTGVNYWYFRNQQRFHRFTYRKSELLKIINEPQLTERELARKLNLRRIYDAGHLKFIYSPNHSS